MYLFCLLYPSETLAEIYKPIEYLNAGYTLSEIRQDLTLTIKKLLQPVLDQYENHFTREDKRWYYLAPALLDGKEYVNRWIDVMNRTVPDADDTTEESGSSGFETHLQKLRQLL